MKQLFKISVLLFLLQSCNSQTPSINGISFVASGSPTSQTHVDAVKNVHANYAAVMPFAFIRNIEQPTLLFNTERQWYGERKEGVKQYIEMLQQNDIKVMMKPQIWISHGEFTGYMKMDSEENWKLLETSYRDFILTFLDVAVEMNIASFCIGTELEQFIVHRPAFWNDLISEIKKLYKGKLTYAANWDEYKRVPFWDQLDYIGVDAYFPVSDMKTPTVADAQQGWQPWKTELKGVSEKYQKQILFTEYGYRSVDFAGKEPWRSERSMNVVNMEAQVHLTQALFNELYHEPWFAGGFIWKWFIEHSRAGGAESSQFSPQNKPVEQTIKAHFKTKS